MATAGRILIIPKGKYNEETQYEMLDMVSYGGKGWVCKKTCIGIAPEDGEYWAESIDVSEELGEINDMLGNTDISAIGDGTVTGGLSAVNENLGKYEGAETYGNIDVLSYFENEAPNGISVLQIGGAVNAYSTVQSWFTFYKMPSYGRIEQRPLNSDIVYVNCCNNGNWWGWEELGRKNDLGGVKFHPETVDATFVNGETAITLDLSAYGSMLWGATVNGNGTNYVFACSVINSTVSSATIRVKCIDNPTLNSTQTLRILYMV
jgi:hypothetical protein